MHLSVPHDTSAESQHVSFQATLAGRPRQFSAPTEGIRRGVMLPIRQSVQVAFHYPVHFTSGLFAPDNALLRDVLTHDAASEPAKALCVIDDGVVASHVGLLEKGGGEGEGGAESVLVARPVRPVRVHVPCPRLRASGTTSRASP